MEAHNLYACMNIRKSDMHTAQLKAVTMKLKINILPVSKKRNVGVDVLSIQDLLLVNAIYLLVFFLQLQNAGFCLCIFLLIFC